MQKTGCWQIKTANTLLLCRDFRSCVGRGVGISGSASAEVSGFVGHLTAEVSEFSAAGISARFCIVIPRVLRFSGYFGYESRSNTQNRVIWHKIWVLEGKNVCQYPRRAREVRKRPLNRAGRRAKKQLFACLYFI